MRTSLAAGIGTGNNGRLDAAKGTKMGINMELLEQYRDRGLCSDGLDEARELLGDEEFASFRDMAEAYMKRGGSWFDVIRVAALLTNDRSWVWLVARIAFEQLPAPLSAYAEALGPENWHEAQDAAHAADNAAAYAANAAACAANADSDDATYAAYATYAAANAAAHADSDDAAQRILRIALGAVEVANV